MLTPDSIEAVQDAIRSAEHLQVRGGGTKSALSYAAGISTEKLSGILEYEPSEYTFTALAGTPMSVIQKTLAENGQYLPFDPPFVEAGATLGGTTAAGLSGPGRFRYGGLRDFFLGVRLVTGEGRIVFGGGKVVKNAAGFDIPKLVTGSCGSLGILVELTFKVFPAPETWTTLTADFGSPEQANTAMIRMAMSQEELYSLDFEPPGRLWMRMGGLKPAVASRIERLRNLLEEGEPESDPEVIEGEADSKIWSGTREFRWLTDGQRLAKVPISPGQVLQAENILNAADPAIARRYSVGGSVLWIALPESSGEGVLDQLCSELGRTAIALTGKWDHPHRGSKAGQIFEDRLRTVFDPNSVLSS